MLSQSEVRVLQVFHDFRMSAWRMLCFSGSRLKTHQRALKTLCDKGMLIEEKFKGGYSLTPEGAVAMKEQVRKVRKEKAAK